MDTGFVLCIILFIFDSHAIFSLDGVTNQFFESANPGVRMAHRLLQTFFFFMIYFCTVMLYEGLRYRGRYGR